MQTNGFVGLVAVAAACSIWQTGSWAQAPAFVQQAPALPQPYYFAQSHYTQPSPWVPQSYSSGGSASAGQPQMMQQSYLPQSQGCETYGSSDYWAPDCGPYYEEPGCCSLDGESGHGIHFFAAPDQSRNQYFAGGGVIFLEPRFDTDLAFIVEDLFLDTRDNQNFDYDDEATARVWVGWQGDSGLAGRVTYFQIEDRTEERATAPDAFIRYHTPPTPTALGGITFGGAVDDFVVAASSFRIYTIDGDITQELNFDRWQTTFGGGVRYTSIEHHYSAVGTASGAVASSDIKHRYDGVGPAISGEIRIPLVGIRDRRYLSSANLSLLAAGRGSVLVGDSKLVATDTTPGSSASADIRDRETVVIAEAQLGAQFDIRTAAGTLIFVKGAWEAQWWESAGNSADPNADFGLNGYSISGGIDW